MRKGFVTFTNDHPKYRKLHDVTVESLLYFTDLEVQVLGINFDYQHDNPRVISKRLNLQREDFGSICYSKLISCLESDFDVSIHVDSDAIATPDLVKIFDEISIDESFLKAPMHPQFMWEGQSKKIESTHSSTAQMVGAKHQTQPYVHASSFVFTKNSKKFFEEAYLISEEFQKINFHPPAYDELIINSLLWKYEKTDCFVDCYDPYFEYFKSLNKISPPSNLPYSMIDNFKVNPYICHGCKDPDEAREILEFLKKRERANG